MVSQPLSPPLCLLGAFLKLLCQVEFQRRGRHFYKGDIIIASICLISSYCALTLFVSAGDRKPRDFCFYQVMFWPNFLLWTVHRSTTSLLIVLMLSSRWLFSQHGTCHVSVTQCCSFDCGMFMFVDSLQRKLHWSHQCRAVFFSVLFLCLCQKEHLYS